MKARPQRGEDSGAVTMECVLKDLIAISKDGEWGKGESFDESVEMLTIRGTDFEDVRLGNTASTPRRHIPKHIAERKQLQPWDVIIEAAGGTKNQITGRTVLLRPQLFSRSDLPLTCASFSPFIRFNTELCDPAFMFWYLQHLYPMVDFYYFYCVDRDLAPFFIKFCSYFPYPASHVRCPSLHNERTFAQTSLRSKNHKQNPPGTSDKLPARFLEPGNPL